MSTLRFFNHRIHSRAVVIGLLQSLLLVGSVYAAVFLRFGAVGNASREMSGWLVAQAVVFALLVQLSMIALGVYRSHRQGGHLGIVLRVVSSFVLAGIGLSIVFYVLPVLYLGRGIMVLATVISVVGSVAITLWDYQSTSRRTGRWRVLFYGAGNKAACLLSRLRRHDDYHFFTLTGCVAVSGEAVRTDSDLIRQVDGSLLAYVRLHRIHEVVVVMDDQRQNFPSHELLACRMAGIHISDPLTFYESQTGRVKTEMLSPHWLIYSDGFGQTRVQNAVKRGLDLIFAVLLLVVAWPFMLLTILTILREDGWRAPVLFTQTRVGRNGREFRIFKFRSMCINAETKDKAQWAQQGDPRITRAGFFMRKHRLDELPQLLNVIRGDMSLVGPRPERPEFVRQLMEKFPYYSVRHQVRPGITGWAQLGYPYGASDEDANAKLQFDLYYVKNRSTFLDFFILLGTVEVVLARKGSR